MFHANIEAGWQALNMFAILATGIFRNSPWHLGQGNLLTILFIADNLTCTMSSQLRHIMAVTKVKELV